MKTGYVIKKISRDKMFYTKIFLKYKLCYLSGLVILWTWRQFLKDLLIYRVWWCIVYSLVLRWVEGSVGGWHNGLQCAPLTTEIAVLLIITLQYQIHLSLDVSTLERSTVIPLLHCCSYFFATHVTIWISLIIARVQKANSYIYIIR